MNLLKTFQKRTIGRTKFLNNNGIIWKFLCSEHRTPPSVSESVPQLSLIRTVVPRRLVLSRDRPGTRALEEASPDYLTDGAVQSPSHHFSKVSAEHSAVYKLFSIYLPSPPLILIRDTLRAGIFCLMSWGSKSVWDVADIHGWMNEWRNECRSCVLFSKARVSISKTQVLCYVSLWKYQECLRMGRGHPDGAEWWKAPLATSSHCSSQGLQDKDTVVRFACRNSVFNHGSCCEVCSGKKCVSRNKELTFCGWRGFLD